MKKIHNIFIVTETPHSGTLKAVIEDAVKLRSMGFAVSFLVPEVTDGYTRYGQDISGNISQLRQFGDVIAVPLRKRYSAIPGDVRYLRRFFAGRSNCLVISHGGYAGKICRLLFKTGSIKLLYHAPNSIDIVRKPFFTRLIERWFERYLASAVSYYIACSTSEARMLHDTYHVSPDKIVFRPNSVECGDAPTAGTEKQYQFIILSRITKDKGVEKVLQACDLLGLTKEVIVIGDGPELPRLRKTYPEATFLGNVGHETVNRYLSQSRFVLSASIFEGLPFSIIEAMSLGVVPVVSNIYGHTDLIIDAYNGFLFENEYEMSSVLFKSQLLSDAFYNYLSRNAVDTAKRLRAFTGGNSFDEHFQRYA